MKQSLLIAVGISGAYATSLSNICNVDYVTNSLPSDEAIQGLVYGDVTAQPVYNSSVEAGNNYPAVAGRNFCNVTVAYSHAGKEDTVSMDRLISGWEEASTDILRLPRSTCGTTSPSLLSTKAASSPQVEVDSQSTPVHLV